MAKDSGRDVVACGYYGCGFDAFTDFVTAKWAVVISVVGQQKVSVGVRFFGFFEATGPLFKEVLLEHEKPRGALWEGKALFSIVESLSVADRFSSKDDA